MVTRISFWDNLKLVYIERYRYIDIEVCVCVCVCVMFINIKFKRTAYMLRCLLLASFWDILKLIKYICNVYNIKFKAVAYIYTTLLAGYSSCILAASIFCTRQIHSRCVHKYETRAHLSLSQRSQIYVQQCVQRQSSPTQKLRKQPPNFASPSQLPVHQIQISFSHCSQLYLFKWLSDKLRHA